MDKFSRLTRNEEWQKGARYRWTKCRKSQLVRSVHPPEEVIFLGWQSTGRRALVGWAEFLHADGSKSLCGPNNWRNRFVLVAPPAHPQAELPVIEDLAAMLAEDGDEPSGKVVIDAERQTVTLHYLYPYEIDLDTIPDEAALLRWLLHLCKKPWLDAARLHEVATVIGEHKGFRLHGLH